MTTETKLDPAATIERLGLTVASTFVPFSQSRNAKKKHKSLNWRVTLQKDGRDIITTDYSAGIAHCPAYKASVRRLGERDSIMRHEAIAQECEGGRAVSVGEGTGFIFKHQDILPSACDVIYSLLADADVLNEFSYEDWAANTGYNPDSRKGEALYRAYLEIALKLRNGIGKAALAELREAFAEY
jgi:hypothetical protein